VYAEILTIGDELCRGEIVDTNSSWLAAQLWERDVTVRWMTSCRDEVDDIRRAVTEAAARADVVLCSGGLGPTEDDLTVDVVSELVGATPVIDEPARQRMEQRFAGRIPVTPIQLRQVRVPSGARVHGNPAGLAPGFEVAVGGVPVICLPGVPRELHAIFESALAERLVALRDARGTAPAIARRIWRVFGRGESQVAQACAGLIDGVAGATIHYQVKFPEVLVKIVIRDRDRAAAQDRLAAVDRDLRSRLAPHLYGDGDDPLPEVTTHALVAAGVSVASAESCTAGMVGQLVTRAAGASASYRGGVIAYANEEKIRLLGVRPETLVEHGAVSEACVIEMAAGAAERFGVDLAVAVSGVAGPTGGTPDKPVGTVWLALVDRRGSGPPVTRRIQFPGTRDDVRTLAAWWALSMLRVAVLEGGHG